MNNTCNNHLQRETSVHVLFAHTWPICTVASCKYVPLGVVGEKWHPIVSVNVYCPFTAQCNCDLSWHGGYKK